MTAKIFRKDKESIFGKDSYLSASVSVFLSLVLAGFLTFCIALTDAVAVNTLRTETEIATDATGWSLLGEYNRELYRRYDLLFVDSGYNSGLPGASRTEERARTYLEANLEDESLLNIRIDNVVLTSVTFAGDDGLNPLVTGAEKYMESKYGLEMFRKLLCTEDYGGISLSMLREAGDGLGRLTERENNTETIANLPNPTVNETVREKNPETGKWEETIRAKEIEIENPADSVNALRETITLSLLTDDTERLSEKELSPEELFSRRRNKLTGSGTAPSDERILEKAEELLLLQKYTEEKFGRYGAVNTEATALDYETEYLLCGKLGDRENLDATARKLLALREGMNVLFLAGNATKKAEISAVAAGLAAVVAAPYLQPIMENAILFSWAYAESLQDVRILLAGGKVPFTKSVATWKTSVTEIQMPGQAIAGIQGETGLDYGEYLKILMLLTDRDDRVVRMADLIEANVRLSPFNENFRLDGCIEAFTLSAEINGGQNRVFSIERSYAYD